MTSWSELDDLGLDQETDEFDPLNPLASAPSVADAEDDGEDWDAPRPRVDEDGEINYDSPFSDTHGAVRVWIDETRAITKVRVAPSWRERLAPAVGKKAGATELTQAFQMTFAAINNIDRAQQSDGAPRVQFDGEVQAARNPLTWDDLRRLANMSEEIQKKYDALEGEEGFGRWEGGGGIGTGAGGKVTVRIAGDGLYESVVFDEAWLDASRAKQVCDAVVAAAAAAWERITQATYVPGVRDELAQEANKVHMEMRSLMKRGFY